MTSAASASGNRPASPPSAGLYVHFPWCVRICTYCDFDRQAHGFELIPRYVDALVTEIARLPRTEIHSVFFGGGTPSLMSPQQVERVLTAAREHLALDSAAEVTLETNPDDTESMDFGGLLAAGVNRISMGVQNLDDRWLRLLGRRHSAAEAKQAVQRARRGGVSNLSLDLMFGLPGLSLEDWQATLEGAVQLAPQHLSCYLLTIDDQVPLGRDVAAGRIVLPDDDAVSEQYDLTRAVLAGAGYRQYEISNWALPGRESRHNLTYWRDEPFLGVGAGAASSWDGARFKTTPVVARYLSAIEEKRPDFQEHERTNRLTAIVDNVSLALRLREGLNLAAFEARFGVRLADLVGDELRLLRGAGVLEVTGYRLRLSDAHVLVTNEVLARLRAAIESSDIAVPTVAQPA